MTARRVNSRRPAPVPIAAVLRLLSCNILAGARIERYRQYFTRGLTQVLPGPGKQANLDRLADLVAQFDLVGLQEADAGSLRSGFLNQTQYLAQAAGMPYWSDQPNRHVARLARSANGLLSRIAPHEVLDYPLPGRIPGRGALLARYREGTRALTMVVAHLSLGPQARARQLDFITELLADDGHAVLMGDLNCAWPGPELERLFARTRLQPPRDTLPTYPSWRPRRAIDHILASDGIEVLQRWTPPLAFSDHLPLAAEIRLRTSSAIAGSARQ